eukprot:2494495-Rhodomonas_salina.1
MEEEERWGGEGEKTRVSRKGEQKGGKEKPGVRSENQTSGQESSIEGRRGGLSGGEAEEEGWGGKLEDGESKGQPREAGVVRS